MPSHGQGWTERQDASAASPAATRIRSKKDGGQYRLVTGRDIITHINGTPITTYDEFRQAIAASPDDMVVRVFDRVTRLTDDYDVALGVAGDAVPQFANRTRFGAYIANSRSGVQITVIGRQDKKRYEFSVQLND